MQQKCSSKLSGFVVPRESQAYGSDPPSCPLGLVSRRPQEQTMHLMPGASDPARLVCVHHSIKQTCAYECVCVRTYIHPAYACNCPATSNARMLRYSSFRAAKQRSPRLALQLDTVKPKDIPVQAQGREHAKHKLTELQ